MGRGGIGVGVGCCLPDGIGGWLERAIDRRARTCGGGEGREGGHRLAEVAVCVVLVVVGGTGGLGQAGMDGIVGIKV